MHRHGHRPMIASGLTRRSLCAAIESSVPSPLGGLRMPPGYRKENQLDRKVGPELARGLWGKDKQQAARRLRDSTTTTPKCAWLASITRDTTGYTSRLD
eukprot:scaffold127447_cov60-Phaeocystis_antarctica.AAC.2